MRKKQSNSTSRPAPPSASKTRPPTRARRWRASFAAPAAVTCTSPPTRCRPSCRSRAARWTRGRAGGRPTKVCPPPCCCSSLQEKNHGANSPGRGDLPPRERHIRTIHRDQIPLAPRPPRRRQGGRRGETRAWTAAHADILTPGWTNAYLPRPYGFFFPWGRGGGGVRYFFLTLNITSSLCWRVSSICFLRA